MWIQSMIKASLAVAASLSALAAPLNKAKIASDAKWIIHLDMEALRNSALGNYVIKEWVNPKLEENQELKNANLTMNVSNITSITAYGPSFEKSAEGVLMISTTADPKKDLDTVTGMFLLSAGTNAPFTMVEKEPYPLYTLGKSVFFAPFQHTLFVAKSKEQIERAHEVSVGKAENVARNSSFRDLRESPDSFFTVAIADGLMGNAAMPPQAQILREANGGRLCVGEKEKNVFMNLVFEGKDEMATTRIQQVLQGIVALVSLSQEDRDITELATSAKVGSEGRNVLVSLSYPADKTIQKIKDGANNEHHGKKPIKAKSKNKKRTAPKSEKPLDEAPEQPPSSEIIEK